MEDPSVARTFQGSRSVTLSSSNNSISFPGIPDLGTRFPPDPYVAVGPNHLMAVVNSRFRISDKSGNTLKTIDAKDWLLSVYPGLSRPFDPKVHYDHFANRWIMVWLGRSPSVSYYLVSVSDDDNPLGTWYNWALPGNVNGSDLVGQWVDYEGVGFDDQAFYITSNQFTHSGYYAYVKVRIMAKAQFYANDAGPITWTDFWDLRDLNGYDMYSTRPAIIHGTPGEYYLVGKPGITPGTYFVLYTLSDPLTSPALSAVHIPVTEWSLAPNAGQLGGDAAIEGGGWWLTNEPVYRDSSLWLVHSVASGPGNQYSSVRYVRINTFTGTLLEDVSFGAEGFWYFYPAIVVDRDGNVAITFSRSGLTEYVGAYFTWRLASDPPGLQPSVTMQKGKAYYQRIRNGRNRWGDYNGIALDPVDSTTFWMFTEYAETGNRWGTWFYATQAVAVPPFYVIEANVSPSYADPGVDSIVVTVQLEGITSGLTLFAEIDSLNGSPIDTVQLFDDGAHNDGGVGDSLFGNIWPVPAVEERHYFVDLQVTLVEKAVSFILNNATRFTTIGPVVYENLVYISNDTLPNPGDILLFRLVLRNNGSTGTAPDVSIELSSDDICVLVLKHFIVYPVDDIDAGETVLMTYDYYKIEITDDCPEETYIPIQLSIASEGYFFWSDSFTIHVEPEVGIASEEGILPEVYALHQNYPNPFNPITTLRYDLPERSDVVLSIYDILGRQVKIIVQDVQEPGFKSVLWNGRNDLDEHVSAGVYLYYIRAGDFVQTRKMVLLK
ncbi:MAG: T9SS type A sorting domain-containing protein [Candidatus Marinimicrobia bacterium]|nr:T9SS type A sorting domain-containing protein [Candidatus Neomarinimicrobiota bacterium]